MDAALIIPENLITFEDPSRPFNTSGGFGDIFIGHHSAHAKVAVKRLRPSAETIDDEGPVRRFRREGEMWRRLNFPHLQPFLGFYYKDDRICLVSPFMENGSLPHYLKQKPDANRRLLLFQTALAIAYLHNECKLIHGDIKGENILVSNEHTALLSDFGLSRPWDVRTSQGQKGHGTLPWQSPELLKVANASKSYESDMYAFGLTIYEVLSGKIPFHSFNSNHFAIIYAITVQNERPTKLPAQSANGQSYGLLWTVAEQCWNTNPRSRLTALQVVGYLDPNRKAVQIRLNMRRGFVMVSATAIFFLKPQKL